MENMKPEERAALEGQGMAQFRGQVDGLVICRGDDTDGLPGQRCPRCGELLVFAGEKTLGLPKNRKAFCEHCPFEESF